MTISIQEAFQRGTSTFNDHDLVGFAEVLADDVAFAAPGGIRGNGKQACVQFFGSWFTAFPDAHVDIHHLHVIDNVAIEEGTFTGTHHGTLHTPTGDLPPTGRPVRIDYVQILRFQGGKHTSFNLMFDRLAMLEQLGPLPQPTAQTDR